LLKQQFCIWGVPLYTHDQVVQALSLLFAQYATKAGEEPGNEARF